MASIRCVAAFGVFFCLTPVLVAATPGPYVAVQVDHYGGGVAPAGGDSKTSATKVAEGRGSGVVVGAGVAGTWLVLTNAHVVEGDSDSWRAVPRIYAGGAWRAGKVIAADAEADLALVRVRFAESLRVAEVADETPADETQVRTHGFAGGRKYTVRKTELRHVLPMGGGKVAHAPQRFFVRTMFKPGESGGAVTSNDQLVGLVTGNDPQAKWGLLVDHAAIAEFVAPFLDGAAPQPVVERKRSVERKPRVLE